MRCTKTAIGSHEKELIISVRHTQTTLKLLEFSEIQENFN